MKTRAQSLLAHARVLDALAERYGHPFGAPALTAARTALLSTLRKQCLRLTYFDPERDRRALLDELRILLDINT